MQHKINALKEKMPALHLELEEATKVHEAMRNTHRLAWEAEKQARVESIAKKESQVNSNRQELAKALMAPHEMSQLMHKTETLNHEIITEKNLLTRFAAEPTWMRTVEHASEGTMLTMRALALHNADLAIAVLEVKAALTPEILEKINKVYDLSHLGNSYPDNLRADLAKFINLLG